MNHFKDPLKAQEKPKTFKKESSMKYDERSSVFVEVGSDYGVGRTSPVGGFGPPKQSVDILPRTSKMMEERQQ